MHQQLTPILSALVVSLVTFAMIALAMMVLLAPLHKLFHPVRCFLELR